MDKTSGDVPSPLLEVCYQCKDSYVHHWLTCINGEDCKIVQDAYETFSVASQNSLEISDASGHTDPLEFENDTTWGMVVRPSKCATRRISPPQGTRKTYLYRHLKRRLGAHLGQNSTGGVWSLTEKHLHINLLELKAVLLALRFFQTDCRNNQVLIASDNTSVVAYINRQGGTRSAELCVLMWRILTWCHQNNVTLRARHIPGSLNVIADGLSRRNQIQPTKWSLSPHIFKQISKLWESLQVDLFATSLNKKIPTYVSPIPDPQDWAVDALNVPWENLVAYAFPPTALLPKVVQKLQSQTCRMILIAPGWLTKPWFWDLVELSLDIPRQLLPIHTLLKQPLNNHYHANPTSLNLHVWYLGVQHSKNMASLQKWQKELLLQRWCTDRQVDFRNPSIGDICNFFWYLFNDLNRCPSTIEGYRTAIADTLGNTKQNISTNTEIARLIASFHRDKPKNSRPIPKWNLSLVLQRLTQPPFEPQEEAGLKFLTWKTVFLLALASGKRRSEIHA